MSDIVLKFANEGQYKHFISSIKDEVIKEIKPEPAYHPCWSNIRDSIETKFRNGYSEGCGHWHNNQQGLYAVFRLAFQQETIKGLKNVDGEKIKSLHDEIFQLIEKYREENQ